MSVRILVVDDHEVVRQGIRTILQARPDWQITGEANNGQEAVRLAKELHPDVIIMDITMPVMSGLEASHEITKMDSTFKVLIFTMHESKSLGSSVRKSGASGYVVKSRAASDLIAAVERLLRGGTFFDYESSAQKQCEGPNIAVLLRQSLNCA